MRGMGEVEVYLDIVLLSLIQGRHSIIVHKLSIRVVFHHCDISVMRRRWSFIIRYSPYGTGTVNSVLRIRIRRIHMFLGLPDPNPLVRGPAPDPSIIEQKY
jgi:hypothetical protein